MTTYGSLFAGTGGLDKGMDEAGLTCLWQVEKDPHCLTVLNRHWPDVPKYDDIKNVGKSNLSPVDVIVGGFPCQGLSVAGKRAGLADERSGLFFEMLRVVYELQPSYVIWENVPGLLSSCSCRKCRRRCARCESIAGADDTTCDVCGSSEFRGRVLSRHRGADFFTVVSAFGVIGLDGAWTLFDAQFFGLAQRRQRLFGVFAQRDIGAERCAEILSLQTRMSGNFTPGKEAGAEVAAPITERFAGGSNQWAPMNEADNLQVVSVSDPLTGNNEAQYRKQLVFGGNNTAGDIEVSPAVTSHGSRYDFESEAFVCNAFNGYTSGADDNNTQGNHIVVGSLASHTRKHGHAMTTQQAAETGQIIAATLNSGGNDGRFRTEPGEHLVWQATTPDSIRVANNQDISPTLSVYMGTGGHNVPMLGVRRLTPTECARLQGFPDDWNTYGVDNQSNRVELSDSSRYRQFGNAVAVPCARWIGKQLIMIHNREVS